MDVFLLQPLRAREHDDAEDAISGGSIQQARRLVQQQPARVPIAVAERADDAVADLAHALALLLADVNGAVRCHSDGRWPEESGNRDTAIDAMLRLALLLRPARDGGDAVSLAVGAPDQAEAQIRDIKLPVRTLGHVRQIAERSRLAAPVGRAACAFSEMSTCIL